MSDQITLEIKNILDSNKIEDLKRFINLRQKLNVTNMTFNYLFHTVQTAGVFITTYAAGYNIKELVWIGIGLNLIASLINVFEKTNNSLSNKLLLDIQKIKEGSYVDESQFVDNNEKKLNRQITTDINKQLCKTFVETPVETPVEKPVETLVETPVETENILVHL